MLQVSAVPSFMYSPLASFLKYRSRKKSFNFDKSTFACYAIRKATDFFDDDRIELSVPVDRVDLPEELQELLMERVKTFNNLAMAQVKIGAVDSALASLREVLKVEVKEC